MSHVDEGTLHAYLDGELPATERASLETHLAQCEPCRARLVEERALLERASALLGAARPAIDPAPAFEQLRREPKRSPWRVRTSFVWAASLALALGVGYYLNDVLQHPDHPAPLDGGAIAATAPRDSAPARGYSAPSAAPTRAAPAVAENRAEQSTARASKDKTNEPALPSSGRVVLRGAPRSTQPSSGMATPVPQPDTIAGVGAEMARAPEARMAQQNVLTERKASANTWPRIDRQTAKAILGEDPVGLPDLMTQDYRRSPDRDGVVVVEQLLDDRTVIQVFQQQAARDARFDSLVAGTRGAALTRMPRERADRLARFVGKLRVEIGGPVSVDSLNRLLEQVGRLP